MLDQHRECLNAARALAWVSVSSNPLKGTDQTKAEFEAARYAVFITFEILDGKEVVEVLKFTDGVAEARKD